MASFDELKGKYKSVLEVCEDVGFKIERLELQNDKLLLRGFCPTQHGVNQIWDEIKRIDATCGDIQAEIGQQNGLTYTVQSGDTLSKIAKNMYGNANAYNTIFEANTNILSDPDKIEIGQALTIPAEVGKTATP
jgi:hypothetical protein